MSGVLRHWLLHGVSLVSALVFAGLHWWLLEGRISVCFEVTTSTDAVARLYWDLGDGFKEARMRAHHTVAHRGAVLCFADPGMRHVKRLRIDPLERAGRFRLEALRIEPLDEVVPWYRVRRASTIHTAESRNQISEIRDGGWGDALGDDPYLVWSIAPRRITGVNLAAVNALILYVILLVGLYLAARDRQAVQGAARAAVALALYPAFASLAVLAAHYVDLARYSRYAIFVTVVLYLLLAGLAANDRRFARAAPALTPVLLILFVMAFDVAYRFGLTQKPLFTVFSNDAYHWRVTRTAKDNVRNSSLRYYRDLDAIRDIVEPGSLFLSDVATSYYVTAALPLYAANTHAHHSRWYARYRRILRIMCGEEKDVPQSRFEQALKEQEAESVAKRRLVLRYMIVNKDTVNKNVRGHCITRNHTKVAELLGLIAVRIYAGEFLDVYEFAGPDGLARRSR